MSQVIYSNKILCTDDRIILLNMWIVDDLFSYKATQHTQISTPQKCKLLYTSGLCILKYNDQQRKSRSIPPKAI